MRSFKLIVSTPRGNMFDEEVTMVSLRGTEGSLAIMAGHIPFITATRAGEVKIISAKKGEILALASEGLLTVTKEATTLLCGDFKM